MNNYDLYLHNNDDDGDYNGDCDGGGGDDDDDSSNSTVTIQKTVMIMTAIIMCQWSCGMFNRPMLNGWDFMPMGLILT